ncbi:hypothetical protein [Pedobacter agri]|uniref:hypothetical protein n=1 Tax=Pedobacter agri TaxID=454586 RepID=UPI00292FB0DB|nr:hypothetical protein [Pedobacter agri]
MIIKINFSLVKLFAITACLYLLSSCERTKYQGYVYDKKIYLPLKNVIVTYDGHQVRSDENGHFIIDNSGEISGPIVFYTKGYNPDSASTFRIHAGETIEQVFTNDRDTVFLSPVDGKTPLPDNVSEK